MAIVNTLELEKEALDWAVAKCENVLVAIDSNKRLWQDRGPHETWGDEVSFLNWDKAGKIIFNEGISTLRMDDGIWAATKLLTNRAHDMYGFHVTELFFSGSTPLIAAMRCYVASKLGDKVEIPDELVENLKKHSSKP